MMNHQLSYNSCSCSRTKDITAILSPKECILAYVNLFRIFMTLPWYLSFIKQRFHTIPARTVAFALIGGGGDVSYLLI